MPGILILSVRLSVITQSQNVAALTEQRIENRSAQDLVCTMMQTEVTLAASVFATQSALCVKTYDL